MGTITCKDKASYGSLSLAGDRRFPLKFECRAHMPECLIVPDVTTVNAEGRTGGRFYPKYNREILTSHNANA